VSDYPPLVLSPSKDEASLSGDTCWPLDRLGVSDYPPLVLSLSKDEPAIA
jgi:hypothetical protein